MGKNLRFVLLGVQGLITIILVGAIIQGMVGALGQDYWPIARAHLLPSLVHLIVTFIAALLLCVFYRANIGAAARVLPMLFFMICLGNLKILPLYHSISHVFILDPFIIGVLYHFSQLYCSFLFLASGLFQQTMNPTKLSQYSFVAAACSLFLSMIVPISASSPSYLLEASITNPLFLGICILITALAIISFAVAIYEEQFSRQTLLRCLAFILMILGNAMITISQQTFYNSIGLILYVSGTTILLLVTRTYHIWA